VRPPVDSCSFTRRRTRKWDELSRVLVTGGAGFIGSHLCDALLRRGDEVVAVDDLSTGSRDNLDSEVELVEASVTDGDAVRGVLARGADAVFHVAGQASIFKSFDRPERDLAANVEGTLRVLEACIDAGITRLVYASSMTVYGEPELVPTPESVACVPISYYGVTKYAAERYVQIAGARSDIELDVTSLRMFNVYGERQSLSNPYQGVLAIFLGNVMRGQPITIHSDGSQTRDFVYVGDVVDAWLRVLDDVGTAGGVFNVGSGRETSIRELAEAIRDTAGDDEDFRFAPAQEGDIRRSAADLSALAAATGWAPRTTLVDGLARTLAWASQTAEA
jgi:UDP-glucose 4-epimerase